MAMIGRVIGRGAASALVRRCRLDWSRGFCDSEPASRTPQHSGPGKLIGKTALITGL